MWCFFIKQKCWCFSPNIAPVLQVVIYFLVTLERNLKIFRYCSQLLHWVSLAFGFGFLVFSSLDRVEQMTPSAISNLASAELFLLISFVFFLFMVIGLQRQLSSGNVMGLVSVVSRWASRASLLVIPVQRFSHTSPLICLQKLEMCLPLADTGLLGYWVGISVIFYVCKILLHPCQPSVHVGPPLLSCFPDGRARWSSGGFTSSNAQLLIACGCPELYSGLFCLHLG